MTGLVFSLVASALLSSGHAAAPAQISPQASEWTFNGNAADACVMESEGRATDTSGAQLEVRCEHDAKILGNVLAKMPAEHLKQRRVIITAEVRAANNMTASLWLKTSRNAVTLSFENDAEQSLTADDNEGGWSQRVISLPVSDDATSVSYGVLLQGNGDVSVRNVQVTISQMGELSADAQAVLDTALAIVKQQTIARGDIAWRVLETDVRLFASGAQQTADVYPAIKYMLAQLGDKRSLLLTPELSNVLAHGASSSGVAKVQMFALPDGSNLVLSATNADLDPRLARNWQNGPTASP